MSCTHTRATRPTERRAGFTLVELLVTIAIIAGLMALTAAGVFAIMGAQQRNNTQTTLDKAGAALKSRWMAVVDQGKKDQIPASVFSTFAGTDANANQRARVIYIKLKLRQQFPMSFNEALNPAPLPANQAYVKYLNNLGITGSTGDQCESSACLLMALTQGVGGGGNNAEDIGAGGASTTFSLSNGSQILALKDAWGNPLFFSRWPTGQAAQGAAGSDPGDPQGLLANATWFGSSFRTNFTSTLHNLPGANAAFALRPMIASPGPDHQLGLNADWSVANATLVADNLYNNP
jgi:prepilin-type N-terminal cleavage/methylation domain-containing protein